MDIDIMKGTETFTIHIDNPFSFNVNYTVEKILDFAKKAGIDLSGRELEDLIARMVKGIAGCEHGCPADALSLVRSGFGEFKLAYIDGGILSAQFTDGDRDPLEIRIFPGFD